MNSTLLETLPTAEMPTMYYVVAGASAFYFSQQSVCIVGMQQ